MSSRPLVFPLFLVGALLAFVGMASAQERSLILVEAESFAELGGWKLDTQSIDTMGSPYLLAHGLGVPVANAKTAVALPGPGRWHVWVRTYDWVARWGAPGTPGRFRLSVDGEFLETAFGTTGEDWAWQAGGSIESDGAPLQLVLHDERGFDGRCDAIAFTREAKAPPNDDEVLPPWRRTALGLPAEAVREKPFDLVVVGGGYSGVGAAISAARAGCRVALIQNRGVLGGNGSSEVRVWSMGEIRRGRFPRIGEIVEEFCDRASKSPGRAEEFEDSKKLALVRAEPHISLFLHHHAYAVETDGGHIRAVEAIDTRTSERRRFEGALFVDTTGHGTLGALAGADWEMTSGGRMGMSNMWRWEQAETPQEFPETPWALPLGMGDFPYPRDFHGQWFWESGYDKDPIGEAEAIRDWNLRAVFGAFSAMKRGARAAAHTNARLSWIAFIGGPRESRRLLGDVVLTQEHVVAKHEFPDGCVPSTWSIDLHYPKPSYAKKFPSNPFISIAEHDQRVDRTYGYPVPYRCFYSRNIENLFLAGRCISVTHEALGTVRVMRTCGMMGEVVGKAAAICIAQGTTPRGVYTDHLSELLKMLELPGKARRASVKEEFTIPADALPRAGTFGPMSGLDPGSFGGLVLDDRQAESLGSWTEGQGLEGYIGWGYRYASADSGARLLYHVQAPTTGRFALRLGWRAHENRGATVLVLLRGANDDEQRFTLDMREAPDEPGGFVELTQLDLKTGQELEIELSTAGAGGFVCADALQLEPID